MAELKDEVNNTSNLSDVDSHINDFSEDVRRDWDYFQFIFYGILLTLIVSFGFVGNTLTMFVLFRREMRSTTIYYLRALVITDSGILLVAVANAIPYSIGLISTDFRYYKCVVFPLTYTYLFYAIMVLRTCNVWVTVFMSVERYIAICHPFVAPRITTKRTTLLVIASVAAFSIVYNIPKFFATTHRAYSDINFPDCYQVVRTDFGKTDGFKIVFLLWMNNIVLFIIPLTALFVLNILIIMELMRMAQRRSTTLRTNIQNADEPNVSLVLVLIVVVFIICHTPGFLFKFVISSLSVHRKLTAVGNTLIAVNSSVNFLIYVCVGRRFRKVLIERVFYKCMTTDNNLTATNAYELTRVRVNV